jgi:hypothetical protein
MHGSLALLFPALLAAIGLMAGAQRSQTRRAPYHLRLSESLWFRHVMAFAGSDLLTGIFILLIAILIELNLILLVPGFGAVIEQCNQF